MESIKLPITLCAIVRNSGGKLKNLIANCRPFAVEVVIADQGSTDGTYEQALELADMVIKRRPKGTADPDRNFVFQLGNQPWVLYLDDDETLEDDTITALPELLNSGADIIWLRRNNFIDGVDASAICGPDLQCRLFKQGAVRFPDKIHEYPQPADNVKTLYSKFAIKHERTREGLLKANRDRERIASPEARKAQDEFLAKVEAFFNNGLRPSA